MPGDPWTRLEHAYASGIEAPGGEIHFLILLAFLVSFGFIRIGTHLVRAQVGIGAPGAAGVALGTTLLRGAEARAVTGALRRARARFGGGPDAGQPLA